MALDLRSRVIEANALPLAPTPFSTDMTAEDWRSQLRDHGEPLVWLQAVEGPEGPNGESVMSNGGKFFVDALLDSEVRVFVREDRKDLSEEEFGIIGVGGVMMDFMPSEISPIRDDRFRYPWRSKSARQVLQPSNETTRPLLHRYATTIRSIYGDGEVLLPSSYSLLDGALVWTGEAPDFAVTIVFDYCPVYEWLGENVKTGPMGSDAERLPTSGPLGLLSAGEE